MKTVIMATVMALGLTSAALAQSKTQDTGFFVGTHVGSFTSKNDRIVAGVNGGYQFNRFLRAEVTADNAWKSNAGAGSMLMVNGVAQYRVPGTAITPYALAGAGYTFDTLGSLKSGGAVAVYNLGAGARLAVSDHIDLDVRYRNIRPFNDTRVRVRDGHLLTAGVSYKF